MLYEAVFQALQENGVKYLVIGGIAVNVHGFERPTGDLDIFVSLEKENLEKFIVAIKSIGWRPRLPVSLEGFANATKRQRWIKEKGMKVFTIYNPERDLEHVDVMTENYLDFEKAYRRRKVVAAKEFDIPVISIPDLIELKKIAGRQKDKSDIKGLKEIRKIKRAKKR